MLTMNRSGSFNLLAIGPNHCGVDERIVVNYHMICECEDALDGRGFLFDQITVDKYFQGRQKSTLSCEKLTIECAQDLMRLIKKENPRCNIRRMNLMLSPSPHKASMTFNWEPKATKTKSKAKSKFISI